MNGIDEVLSIFHDAINFRSILKLKAVLGDSVLFFDGANSYLLKNESKSLIHNPSLNNCLNFKRTLLKKNVSKFGNLAIISCGFVCTSEYGHKHIEFESLETLVLTREVAGSWKVTNIHWSS